MWRSLLDGWRSYAWPVAQVPRKIRDAVHRRDRHACVCCGATMTSGSHLQHRIPRGMGGSKDPHSNCMCNLANMCPTCHLGRAEAELPWAYDNGYRVPRGMVAAEVPILWFGQRVLLNCDGTVTYLGI